MFVEGGPLNVAAVEERRRKLGHFAEQTAHPAIHHIGFTSME
jgi:hypothetical protein